MDERITAVRGETVAHSQLKRLAVLWAQAQGYSACAVEVSLPRCHYRADVAAFRPMTNEMGCTVIFECKQAMPDLRRDNCCTSTSRQRLETVQKRRQIIEKHLRVHYPNLRRGDSLFAEFDSHDFLAIGHRNYARLIRELTALQNQIYDGTKFEKLVRYRCANLFFLVLPNELFRAAEIPIDWGALVESNGTLTLARKPIWQDTPPKDRMRFLHRIAMAGTRQLNKKLGITFEEVLTSRRKAVV
ncbi:MAG: hypothetical protein M3O66_06185 [Verrucomicrobiota bacterium]|nr:hypothetical protein [Verrucomicrobiota bacterium]